LSDECLNILCAGFDEELVAHLSEYFTRNCSYFFDFVEDRAEKVKSSLRARLKVCYLGACNEVTMVEIDGAEKMIDESTIRAFELNGVLSL